MAWNRSIYAYLCSGVMFIVLVIAMYGSFTSDIDLNISSKYLNSQHYTPHVMYRDISNSSQSSYESNYPHFPSYLSPRTQNIPVINKFHLDVAVCPINQPQEENAFCGDFIVSIYYISRNSGWMSIRRLDSLEWKYSMHLNILDANDHTVANRILIQPNPASGWNKLFFNTHIDLVPDISVFTRNQTIPKTILQTYYNRDAINAFHWNAFFTFVDLNPEYAVKIMTDVENRQFIKDNFPANILEAYDSLIPTAFQADLFRYCYLYIVGGCYFDNKMILRKPLRSAIYDYDDLILCSDVNPGGYMASSLRNTHKLYNAIICSKPKDKRIGNVITSVINNIENKHKSLSGSDLALTGPVAFYEAIRKDINDENVALKHGYSVETFYQAHISGYHREYNEYYVINKRTDEIIMNKAFRYYYSHRSSSQHGGYSTLWKLGRVFYEPPVVIMSKYKVFIESYSKRFFSSQVKNESIIITPRPQSYLTKLWNRMSFRSEHKSGVLTPKISVKVNGVTKSLDCKDGSWFDSNNASKDILTHAKSVYQDNDGFIEQTIKIIDESSGQFVLLTLSTPSSTNTDIVVDLCI